MTSSSLLEGIFFSLFIAGAILAVLVFKPGNQQAVRGSPLPPTSVQQKEAPPFPSRSTSETTPTHIGKDETTSDDGQSKPTTATGAEQNPLIEAHSDGSRAQPTCFRISGIPSDWDRNKLEQALRDIDPDLDLKERDELYELCPACCESTQTALLNLERCTAYFQNFQQNEERSKVITENGRKIRLVFDKHFYDLTPMNGPATPIVADVIAITGLGGHAYGSWRSRTMTERSVDRPMWLRDFLPVEIVGIRIMTYGYDSSLRNPNGSNLTDYRRNFIECLQNSRGNCPKRPIIFIGHSLGGILVVQTLVELRKYSKYHAIFDCVRGIFFFGTPHQGLRTVELEEMAGELDDADSRLKVQNLLRQLQDGSEFLENQKDDLSELWGKFHGKVFTFYETDKTQSVKKVSNSSVYHSLSPASLVLLLVLLESVLGKNLSIGAPAPH
ncbi:hypothetical protein FN846DRAFT_960911 [Sphaerosporella brunnea]|uniref:Alpha/Beta hydrolase protein n=1 Tax=Sphaerosporella brunnea TaxID=1250544 RepID=A0A5J5EPX9_9PEZI|nr:hypothetical protein FN846DRAFT_960911 [Sphaerosporella brunnea]